MASDTSELMIDGLIYTISVTIRVMSHYSHIRPIIDIYIYKYIIDYRINYKYKITVITQNIHQLFSKV